MGNTKATAIIGVSIAVGIACWLFVQAYHPVLYPWTGLAALGMFVAFGVALTAGGYYWGPPAARRVLAKV